MNKKIFYLGPKMSFSYNVAISFASKLRNYELHECKDFNDLYSNIKNNNYVVIPYKNSKIGYVHNDLYKKYDFDIIDDIKLEIIFYIAYSGNIQNCKKLYVNDIAYKECKDHLPNFMKNYDIVFTNSNSLSSIKCKNDNNSSCITNKTSLDYYKLNTLQKINIPNNFTYFQIVTN